MTALAHRCYPGERGAPLPLLTGRTHGAWVRPHFGPCVAAGAVQEPGAILRGIRRADDWHQRLTLEDLGIL
jgi:hypothetical protein